MKLAFVFPGQGSQRVGMLQEAYAAFESVRETFLEAGDILSLDLWSLICSGPEAELNKTELTQPAILASSIALYRAWLGSGGSEPDFVAGHSLGEYSALVVSQALSFADALRLVHQRGRLMQEAVPAGTGAMAAVLNLADDVIARCCDEAAVYGVVAPANYNSPGQVVIAGEAKAVAIAGDLCKQAGAKRILPLAVSVPSHCELMRPASVQLEPYLVAALTGSVTIPVVQNVCATEVTARDQVRENLVQQLYKPVLWTQSVARLAQLGVEAVVECGPGKVLSGLIKRIDKSLVVYDIEDVENLAATIKHTGSKE